MKEQIITPKWLRHVAMGLENVLYEMRNIPWMNRMNLHARAYDGKLALEDAAAEIERLTAALDAAPSFSGSSLALAGFRRRGR